MTNDNEREPIVHLRETEEKTSPETMSEQASIPASAAERSPQLDLKWHDSGAVPTIKLENEVGEKVGEAEFRLLTTPDIIQKTDIDLNQRDAAQAAYVHERVEESGVTDYVKEHIAEDRLHAALHVLFRNFNEATGGQVLEATKVTWHQDQTRFGGVEPSETTDDRMVRTFIIAKSARGDMESFLSSAVQGSVAETGLGLQFDVDPIYNEFLGDRGFTRRVRVTAENGVDKEVRLNFLYGSEKGERYTREKETKEEDVSS